MQGLPPGSPFFWHARPGVGERRAARESEQQGKTMKKNRIPVGLALPPLAAAVLALPCAAQETQAPAEEAAAGSPVVVTATRIEQESFDLPTAISSIGKAQIQETGKPQVNISEQLNTVPGTLVQNRDSYAQEQQIIIRGFGARSQFGTRGVKLLADGIPASTPDGQGGPGLFDLSSAERIEVLRGPFSALYGNHSGGVVQVFTEDGPERPTVTATGLGGSWGTWKGGLKFGGSGESVNYIGSLSTFHTDGYREHSEARKDQFNAKLAWDLERGGNVSLVVNYLNQPDNQDPLGLTKEQAEDDPRQAVGVAEQYDTGRSLDNLQTGLVYELPLSDSDTLRLMAYAGDRDNNGFLGIPLATQRQVTQSGGVTVLDRTYGGLGARWTHMGAIASRPFTVTTGADFEFAEEDRKGYLNEFGSKTLLKRDEDNTVDSWGGYVQAEWQTTERLAFSGGLRYTKVSFESDDSFVCTVGDALCPAGVTTPGAGSSTNPDDSGRVEYSAWTPVAGVVYKLTPTLNLYGNIGRSFETPTFIELAYRQGGSGLNFDLDASLSNHYEIGAKAFLTERTRLEVALFHIDTSDEIVVESNSGGRATFQNADTSRTGAELALDTRFGRGFAGLVSFTWLDAEFDGDFATCPQPAPVGLPPCGTRVTVPDGNKVPGVPEYALYGELSWAYAPWGFNTAVEVRWQDKVYVNDVNSEFADAFTVVNLRAGLEQRSGRWRFTEFARVDNVLDEEYIGGVIVNDGNGRYYAPAPTASLTVGASVSYAF
jgi:iron complex outermembrane receptor protein